MGNARGSLSELKTQLIIARELGYIDDAIAEGLLSRTAEIGRMLNGLYSSPALNYAEQQHTIENRYDGANSDFLAVNGKLGTHNRALATRS